MNIFFLDWEPQLAAQYHCDRHVIKMITETSQMISTCHYILDKYQDPILMKPTHTHHPCNIWIRESKENYNWLRQLLIYLLKEYDSRYRIDNFVRSRKLVFLDLPRNIPYIKMTNPVLAMPDNCKTKCPVESYRNYYKKYKCHIVKWKNGKPKWY